LLVQKRYERSFEICQSQQIIYMSTIAGKKYKSEYQLYLQYYDLLRVPIYNNLVLTYDKVLQY
jgi:hypothetical protein